MNTRLLDSDIVSELPRDPSLAAPNEIGFSLSGLKAALATADAQSPRELYDHEIVTVRVSSAARGGWQDSTSLLLAATDSGGARK